MVGMETLGTCNTWFWIESDIMGCANWSPVRVPIVQFRTPRIGGIKIVTATPVQNIVTVASPKVTIVPRPIADIIQVAAVLKEHVDARKVDRPLEPPCGHVLTKAIGLFIIIATALISLAIFASRHYNAEYRILR